MSKKILVAEDSPTVLMMIKMTLEKEGYEVITSSDGMEALNKARTSKPDLIVLDCILPKLDGYNICRMLKFDSKFNSIPIFMFTARSGSSDKIMGQKTGADEYIPKSSSVEELGELVEKINQYLK